MKKNTGFYVLVGFILFLVIGAYSNHFNNPFEFDDSHTIVYNNAIRSLKNIPQFFTDATTFSSLPANQSYRPGVTTLNAIDYWLGGKTEPEPFYFHVSIFISYVCLGFLLYFFFLKIFDQTITHKWNKYFAIFGTGFFCLHAANAETINYIISRSDSFSTLMVVLSMVIYTYKPAWRNKLIYLLPVIVGFFMKEPTIMIAPILFVYILLFDKHLSIPEWFSKKGFKEAISSVIRLLPLFILIILLVALSVLMTPDTFYPSSIPRINYILTQPFVILHYFGNFILPLYLSADTDWVAVSTVFDYRVLIGMLFIIGLIIAAIYCSTKVLLRPISFGIIWFFMALLPTSLTSLSEVLNDHRTFFPYIGLVIASTWLCVLIILNFQERIEKDFDLKFRFLFICIFILIAHAYGTWQRNKVWSSGETLWYDVTVKSPNNGRGLMNYAVAKMEKGEYETALKYYEKALELTPNYSYLYVNMAIVKAAMGNNNEVEGYYKKALSLNSKVPVSYFFYATWLKSQKRYKEALEIINTALQISPEQVGNQQLRDGLIILVSKEGNEVAEAINKATQFPTAENYIDLSFLYYNLGSWQKSADAAALAITKNKNSDIAYNNICSAYNMLKLWDKAIEAGEKGLKINPNNQLLKNNLEESKKGKAGL